MGIFRRLYKNVAVSSCVKLEFFSVKDTITDQIFTTDEPLKRILKPSFFNPEESLLLYTCLSEWYDYTKYKREENERKKEQERKDKLRQELIDTYKNC